jgi:hypothetical protein
MPRRSTRTDLDQRLRRACDRLVRDLLALLARCARDMRRERARQHRCTRPRSVPLPAKQPPANTNASAWLDAVGSIAMLTAREPRGVPFSVTLLSLGAAIQQSRGRAR